jgi:diacylglycerol kinase family enzyme
MISMMIIVAHGWIDALTSMICDLCHRVMLVCIDGENSGETPMTVECLHNALRVFALA